MEDIASDGDTKTVKDNDSLKANFGSASDDASSHEKIYRNLVKHDQQGWLVYAGRWFDPLRQSMDAFIIETTTGSVTLKLYKGSLSIVRRTSPYILYRQDISSFEEGSGIYNQADAAGFIRLYGLPMRVRSMVQNQL